MKSPGLFTPGSPRRTAVCGPACTVVWEGRAGDCSPYPDSVEPRLVDVVLLPVEGGVRLNDDVLVRGLLEFVDEHGLAGLQGFGDFGIHADGEIRAFVIRRRHLARFGLDFIAQRWDGLNHPGTGA